MQTNRKLLIIIIILITGIAFIAGGKMYKYTHKAETYESTTDTVTVQKTDTVYLTLEKTISKPQPVKEYIIRYDTIYTESPQTHFNVPITAKHYADSVTLQDSTRIAYNAKISGYSASLDTIAFRVRYPVITNTTMTTVTNTIYKQPKLSIGLSVGAGYGIIHRQADIFAGITLTYPIPVTFGKRDIYKKKE